MEIEEYLNWQLEAAKSHPMEVHLDFNTRYRVWTEQILPGRLNEVRQNNGDLGYIARMISLDLADLDRLSDLVKGERLEMVLMTIFEQQVRAYMTEAKQ